MSRLTDILTDKRITQDSTRVEMVKSLVDEIIGEELDYEKYGKCPSCTASMMYQCTCDSGSLYTVIKQRERAKKLL